VAVLLFLGFHLGIGLTMRLGLFAWISALAWVVFLPGSAWRERVDGRAQDRSRLRDAIVTVSVLMSGLNLMNPRLRPQVLGEPSAYHYLATLLGWEQRWPMFAPRPSTTDPWWSIEGITTEGRRMDLWSGGAPGVKPAGWDATYRNSEWFGYLFQVSAGASYHREALANYFCREWNGDKLMSGRNTAKRQVDTVSVTMISEPTPAPGRPPRAEQRQVLWKGACP
jgi:hypothetical protein